MEFAKPPRFISLVTVPFATIRTLEIVSRGDWMGANLVTSAGGEIKGLVPAKTYVTWFRGNGAFELQGESRVLGIAGQFRLTLESLKSIVRDADSADQFTVSDSSGKSTPGVQKLALGYTYECPRGDRDEYTTTLDVRVGHTTVKLPVKDTSRAWRFQRMPRGKASKSA